MKLLKNDTLKFMKLNLAAVCSCFVEMYKVLMSNVVVIERTVNRCKRSIYHRVKKYTYFMHTVYNGGIGIIQISINCLIGVVGAIVQVVTLGW